MRLTNVNAVFIALMLALASVPLVHSQGANDSAQDGQDKSLQHPLIVVNQRFSNRRHPLPKRVLYTPLEDGMFRVSIYLRQTAPANPAAAAYTSYLCPSIGYTDDAGELLLTEGQGAFVANSFWPSCLAIGTTATPSIPVPSAYLFQAKAGKPITFSIDQEYDSTPPPNFDYGPYVYEAFVVVERL